MYNPNNIQYVFKQSSGKLWNFYFDEKLGICYSNLNKRNSWTEPVSIQKNLHSLFYADMDNTDCFHFIYQNLQGSIAYATFDNGIAKTYPLLSSKIPQCYNKHLFLIPLKNITHLLYTLKHNNSVILTHQTFINGSTSTPKVIDYVTESNQPYSAAFDKSGNIYAFYQSSDGKFFQIGYKKYIPIQKIWGDFTPITKYSGDNEFPHTVIDDRNIIHLCYQRRANKQFELVYQQKVPDKNIWCDEIILHGSINSFDNASMIYTGNRITIYWVRDDIIYHCFSEDNGSTWSKASRYNFSTGRQLMCMSYKSNLSDEMENIICPQVPGNFINGYKLAFYQEPQNRSSEMSAEELKLIILDGIKLLKGSVEDLKESDNNINESITKLTSIQQSFEREMVKYSVKLGMMENELNQIKQLYSRIDRCNELIDDLKSKVDLQLLASNDHKTGVPPEKENPRTNQESEVFNTKEETKHTDQSVEKTESRKIYKLRKPS